MELADSSWSTSVVGDSFCVPYPVELIVKKKYHGLLLHQRYQVLDVNGNLFFQVDGSSLNLHKKRVMRDAAGSPILTMREKVNLLTLRHWWTVHRGKSYEQKDFIFGVKRSHPLEMKPRLDVSMENHNTNFRLVKSYSDLSCKVYRGDTVIAQVTDGFPTSSFFKYKESFRVQINEGVDYAFILALLVIATVNDYI